MFQACTWTPHIALLVKCPLEFITEVPGSFKYVRFGISSVYKICFKRFLKMNKTKGQILKKNVLK